MNNKKNESGNVAIIVVILIVVIAIVASNFVGPAKGWLTKIINPPPPPTPTAVTIKKEEPKKEEPKKEEPKKEEPKKEVVKKEEPKEVKEKQPTFKEKYDKLYKKFKKKLKKPIIGREYTVVLGSKVASGKIVGILKKRTPGKIVIKSGKVTATYPINVVNKQSYPKLFPERAAQMLALNAIKKEMKAKINAAKKKKEEEIIAKKEAIKKASLASKSKAVASKAIDETLTSMEKHEDTSATVASVTTADNGALKKYNPKPLPTPEHLKVPLKTFAEWLEMQRRKMHGKIAKKIYAKQYGDQVVVYLQATNLFKAQDYDFRYSVTNGMWQIWGFKCVDAGVVYTPENAHIVILDSKNKIIGGSTIKDSSAIWVKK
jgi:hypothetical protein